MYSLNAIGNLVIEHRLSTVSQQWVHVGSRLDPRFGGIASSLPPLCRAIAEKPGNANTIVGFCAPDECTAHLEDPGLSFLRLPRGRVRSSGAHSSVRNDLASMIRQADGVHIHGIWDEHSSLTGTLASQCGTPYIVSAHGMLERWAVRQKRWKKAIYSAMFERETLRRSSCLRALTSNEVEDYRRYGVHGPVAVIPNGVERPEGVTAEPFLRSYPALEGKRLVLFLGRIHHKKGVDTLCRVWCRIAKQMDDVHLVLAGPGAGNTEAELKQIVEAGRASSRVTFTGMLDHIMKWSALAASSLFLLPSHSEGFSVAVLEALAMAVPVVISPGCHFPDVKRVSCGWESEVTAEQLEQTLTQALSLPADKLGRMGARGQQLVHRDYSWSAVGGKMRELQNWILFGTTPPTVQIQ